MSRAVAEVRARRIDLRSGYDGFFTDRVAVDAVARLIVNGVPLAWFNASPEMLRELAVGYLLSEGFAGGVKEILRVDVRGRIISAEVERSPGVAEPRYYSIGCGLNPEGEAGIPRVSSELRVPPGELVEASERLIRLGSAGRSTGGLHSALLHDHVEGFDCFAEDVGRHNAVDKVIGLKALSGRGKFGDSILLTSGRQSGEVVLKAAAVGIPIVASFKAPTYTGVSMAEESNVTLVGLLMGRRMTVYTSPERILPIART
ncbi:MAG: formate dehydrogenase accessory sulfurtransferase FdhD [Candidatus Bathyarchaeia archaeon]